LTDILILVSDILGVSIMGAVGLWGGKYFAYILRNDDLKNLRYIWIPSAISGGFFFALVSALFINDIFGGYHSPFYIAIHIFLLAGSAFFGLSAYRFIKTIKFHMESKKNAEASLEQMQSELVKRQKTTR